MDILSKLTDIFRFTNNLHKHIYRCICEGLQVINENIIFFGVLSVLYTVHLSFD